MLMLRLSLLEIEDSSPCFLYLIDFFTRYRESLFLQSSGIKKIRAKHLIGNVNNVSDLKIFSKQKRPFMIRDTLTRLNRLLGCGNLGIKFSQDVIRFKV